MKYLKVKGFFWMKESDYHVMLKESHSRRLSGEMISKKLNNWLLKILM